MASKVTVDPGKLTRFSTKILQKVDVPREDAERTAGMLVAADLRGIDSHGVAHLGPLYIRRIKEGLINPKPQIKMVSHTGAMAGMVKVYHDLPKAPGVERITLAGEVEHEIEMERRHGIPLDQQVIASLQELAKEFGVEYDL